MGDERRVQAMIDTLETAKDKLGEAEAKQREAYQNYLSASGALWQAQQSYRHARGQLEALAVQGLRMAPVAAPESLAGLQRREAYVAPPVAPKIAPVEGPAEAAGLSDEAIAELRRAEAEDNAAEEAAVVELEVVSVEPLTEVTVEQTIVATEPEAPAEMCDDVQANAAASPDDDYGLSDPAPVSNRQPAPKPQVDEDQARIQVFQQALEQEYRSSLKPRIPRQNKEWQMLSRSFTDPVFRILDEANGPVALAVICQTLKGLYTVETTKAYLRDMISAGYVQRIGPGHYAKANWKPTVAEDPSAGQPRRAA